VTNCRAERDGMSVFLWKMFPRMTFDNTLTLFAFQNSSRNAVVQSVRAAIGGIGYSRAVMAA
jgi:hypothetical protein